MKEKFTKFLVLLFSLATLSTYAQQKKVSGTVTAKSDGLPLPAVSVVVKGTSLGTQTDADGKYSISVPNGGSIVFTYVGFQSREVKVGATSTINIAMESDERQLGEVVVTAMGVQRKKNELPYAAQQVKGEDISKARDANFVNSLSGKVAGLEIRKNNTMGGSTNIVLRGSKSLTGNNQALFVVDGVPYDNSNTNTTDQKTGRGGYDYGNAAADINPDDIESINVLKGAAATALYGSRASNGVVMVTTKKGSKGMGITINSGVTVGSLDKSTFPKYQKQYGAGYGKYYGPDPDNDPKWFNEGDVNGDGVTDLIVPFYEDASWGAKFDSNLMVYDWASFDPTSSSYGKPRPWVAAANDPTTFFENPVAINNSIMVDGGGEKGYYKFGYVNNHENGMLPNSKIDKNIFNFGASYKITDKLTTTATINASKTAATGRYGTGYDDKNIANNFRQWWQNNVDIKEQKDAYFRNRDNVTWNWASATNLKPIFWDNPYFSRYENYENDSRTRFNGNFSLSYKLTSWMDVMGRAAIDSYSETQEERQAYGSVTTSAYSNFKRNFDEYNYDLLVNFNKNISPALTFKGLVGGNIRKTNISTIDATTNGGLVVPRLYSLSNSASPVQPPLETAPREQVNGIFASASFGYKELLFLDLTGRRDQSSTLPSANNTYYYPSASLGFVFSKFTAATAPWISLGKVRLNYAEVGASAPASSLVDVYKKPLDNDGNPYSSFGSTPLYVVSTTKNNGDLKPERTKSSEIGLEMSFVDQRLGFDVTYYKQNTVDQIVPLPVSRATGYDRMYVNAGNIENKGIEVSAFGTAIKTPSFSWQINLNWSRNRNKVVELPGVDNLLLASMQGGVSINAALGEPYGTIRGGNFVFDDNGNKVVIDNSKDNNPDNDALNGFYQASATSNEIIGNINPDWIGGMTNSFRYKNLAFSFLIDVRQGGQVFSLDQYYGLATGMYEETAGLNDLGNPVRNPKSEGGGVILPGVKPDGTPNDIRVSATNFGTFGYRRNPAAAFVYDASFVKLREMSLTYSLPASVVSRIAPFKGIDLSLIGRNLWIIHKNLPNADPEDGMSSGNVQGYQVGSYPTARTFGFNVKLKF
ncbi:SusC/RagA family TonB-linked outer membrane protein [Solitalea canadensis]|uniref:TonB-linked outer membrane protein, SusC/RagA family n=1 Tax=Solitalea canadensis (strain ATCC 29591 / DSM 3403 / JCM 21819 / LMG 8368 / NBRC 15130 / NCIMB 12057 / USAM 9D) TaxID=929556 RepID=H8KX50_SOLCM|nr:SusC/RagA family TonB-linked outer membrane protein [Solitalea canadensis]AFD08379.1 TonB-linked outer membrane protein, SusC/RagA family [Solitalea canadensis DSM 3403]